MEPDHLGTPRSVIDPIRDLAIWQWPLLGNAFGDAAPITDPDGDGVAFAMNLRFPGQYFDAETGLHYNYYRDYEPSTGRYVESDPIGLAGGLNTYLYAEASPLSNIDPTGEAVVVPVPFPIPNIPAPGPIVIGVGSFAGGFWIGTQIYPYIEPALSSAIDAVCNENAREKECEENLKRDLETCAALGKRNGNAAYRICEQRAMLRYGNCLSGRDQDIDAPLPPWSTR